MTPSEAQTIQVWLGAAGIFAGCMAGVWGLAWSFHNKIESKVRERNEKLSVVFRRMDECKSDVERKYQPKEVCTILHKTLSDKVDHMETDLHEIKGDVKTLIRYANGKIK